MNKVKTKTAKTKSIIEMPIVNPYSAGIDVGDKELVVALPEGLTEQRVRTFGSMTCDLQQIVELLKECEIDSVAMESTGVYWKPLFSILVRNDFEVNLVNAAHVKNVTGRKTE
jgi:transposase